MAEANIADVLVRQYRAGLAMLLAAMRNCPAALWFADEYENKYWHIAYHTLFYTHLYLHPSEAECVPWAKHRPEYRLLGVHPGYPARPKPDVPYSQAELLELHQICVEEVAERVRAVPLDGASGFAWLPFSRMELHVYNIRHIQHHTAQLIERLRTRNGIGTDWVR